MIEFKAECGHTVRARDEDAGDVVRCSYCGRPAAVPDRVDGGLDFLLREIDASAEPDPGAGERRRRRRKRAKPPRGDSDIDPLGVVLKLCYVAVLVVVLYVAYQRGVKPLLPGKQKTAEVSRREPPADQAAHSPRDASLPRGKTKLGVLDVQPNALYVASVPSGAAVYCVEESKVQEGRCLAELGKIRHFFANTAGQSVPDGNYIVEVSLNWHDRTLSQYPDYWGFRRRIEEASDAERRQILQSYFLPDEASDAFIHTSADRTYLVRRYRVEVRGRQGRGIRALFLPRLAREDGHGFAITPLVRDYLVDRRAYAFDEEVVRGELAYYGVAVPDRDAVVAALSRIGAIPYMTPDNRIRMFKIGIRDGVFGTLVVGEREP